MNIEINIKNIQHIKHLSLSFDLTKNKLMCLAGKNSVGKTTLLRAIRNLYLNNTFIETAAPYIFNNDSSVQYKIDNKKIKFTYNSRLGVIDTRQDIPNEIKNLFLVELPIPHGNRFSQFRYLSELDEEIRAKIAIGEYSRPDDLITFLNKVYQNEKFNDLKSVAIKKNNYYFILKDENERYYIREDYFSSGEYFVISLYRNIQHRKKAIFIDEIDISLDASAQVNLIKCLRDYCDNYHVNIIFTTHSLGLMKTLSKDELFYIEKDEQSHAVSLENRSYNFIKSVLYEFNGYDKYILTEDECLERYIRYVISREEKIFNKYQVIYIAGGSQVIDLMKRNKEHEFLTADNNVIAILDGDQKEESYHNNINNVFFLPYPNIEMEILSRYDLDLRIPRVNSIDGTRTSKRAKNLYWKLTKNHGGQQLISHEKLYDYLESIFPTETSILSQKIINFLS
ncbi:AAA family ATPase [Motilimonas sp. 1_MG-2023]|uniref:ATP-dependent nuclease n=1 Tax=Motilimonas sp. 1_MG-2023 TaxID=3062672 RepID=UPI0026E24CD1|nr:AAA family ATPase [Motilimonas sp. 1_MG-2023]MDO6527871.1 AAA family ATPase [Motilimonas sp. 1_MG-2023]